MKRRILILWTLNAAILNGMEPAVLVNRLHSSVIFEKMLAVNDYLSNPRQYSQISVGDTDEVLNACRSNRELWIHYIAGYVKFKNVQFITEATPNWPIKKQKSTVQLSEYEQLYSLFNPCLLPSGDVIAGLAHEEKIFQKVTYKYYFLPIYNTHKQSHIYFKLIHLPTKKTLLQKKVDDACFQVIINNELPIEMAIVNNNSDSCEKVNISAYYEALSNYYKAPLEDFIFYSQYDAAY